MAFDLDISPSAEAGLETGWMSGNAAGAGEVRKARTFQHAASGNKYDMLLGANPA